MASNLIERVCVATGHLVPRPDADSRGPALGSTVLMIDGEWAYCRAAALARHQWRSLKPALTLADAVRFVQRVAAETE